MATYEDYRNDSTLEHTASGKKVTRTIYLRAESEVDVLANVDCPYRGMAIEVGAGSLTEYIYCDTVSVAAISEAGGKNPDGFLYRVTASFAPINRGNPQINKAAWSISFRAQPFTRLYVDEETDQTHYGPASPDDEKYPRVTTAINQGSNNVDGVEIDEMVEVLTIEFWKHPNDLEDVDETPGFLSLVRGIAGTVNDADFEGPWGNYVKGEARITGLTVGVTQGEMASVQIEISRSAGVTGREVVLDSMVNPVTYDKEGWQYQDRKSVV